MKKLILLLILVPLLFSSCSSLKVASEFDPAVDFSQYKTYSFLPWNKQSDEILTNRDKESFRNALSFEMENLGYVKVDNDADLAVNIFIIIDQKTGTSTYADFYTSGTGVGYYYGPWGHNNPGGVSAYTVMHSYDYEQGTLILDILDVKKKQIAWQGIARKTIKSNPKGDGESIKVIMAKLFEKFPLEKDKK